MLPALRSLGAVQRAAPVNNRKNTGRGRCGSRAPAIRGLGAAFGTRAARPPPAEPLARFVEHDAKQRSFLVPGRVLRPGASWIASSPDQGSRAERRRGALFCCRASEARPIRTRWGAARPMTRDARLSALHRGDLSRGPRFHLRHSNEIVQRAPRSQVVLPGAVLPRTSRVRGYEPQPQDATPRSAFRIVSRRRPS